MRLFGGDRMDRIASMMQRTDIPDDMPIQAGLVSKAIEGAQRQVETMNFAARKYVLEYDDVMNKQREVIYGERNAHPGRQGHPRPRRGDDGRRRSRDGVLEFCPERIYSEEWDWDGLVAWYRELTGIDGAVEELRGEVDNPHELADALTDARARGATRAKEEELGAESLRELERQVMLRVIDTRWMDHLQEMDYLKEGIGLRAMGQRDPLVEYKTEAYDMFGASSAASTRTSCARSCTSRSCSSPSPRPPSLLGGELLGAHASRRSSPAPRRLPTRSASAVRRPTRSLRLRPRRAAAARPRTVVKDKDDPWADVGRNDPCPCGSGKKYKKCHGANA